jgi:hypothetical protein
MQARTAQMLTVRIDALTMALTEIARTLSLQQSARAANAIGARVAQLVANGELSDRADAALAADLAPLMSALHRGRLHPLQR